MAKRPGTGNNLELGVDAVLNSRLDEGSQKFKSDLKKAAAIVQDVNNEQLSGLEKTRKAVQEAGNEQQEQARKLRADLQRENAQRQEAVRIQRSLNEETAKEKHRQVVKQQETFRQNVQFSDADLDIARQKQILAGSKKAWQENRKAAADYNATLHSTNEIYGTYLDQITEEKILQTAAGIAAEDAAKKRLNSLRRTQLDLRDLAFGLQQIGTLGKSFFDPAIEEGRKFGAELSLIKGQIPTGELDGFRKSLIEMDPALGKAGDQAEQLFEILQAGVKGEDSLTFLRDAAVAARGDFEKTTDAVGAGIPVYANYKKQVKDTADLFDRLQVVVDVGRVKFKELGNALGPVGGQAEQAGIKLNDFLAAYSALTLVQSPEQAATSLQNAIKAIVDPASEARKEARLLGIEFSEAALRSRGLVGLFKDISGSGADSLKVLKALFPDLRGVRGSAFLAGEGLGKMEEALRDLENSTGRSAKKFAEWRASLDGQLEAASGSFSRFQANVTDSVDPLLRFQLGIGVNLLEDLRNLDDSLSGIPSKIGFLATQVAAVGGPLTLAAVGIRQFSQYLSPATIGAVAFAGKLGLLAIGSIAAYEAITELDKATLNFADTFAELIFPEESHIQRLKEIAKNTDGAKTSVEAVNQRLAEHKKHLEDTASAADKAAGKEKDLETAFQDAFREASKPRPETAFENPEIVPPAPKPGAFVQWGAAVAAAGDEVAKTNIVIQRGNELLRIQNDELIPESVSALDAQITELEKGKRAAVSYGGIVSKIWIDQITGATAVELSNENLAASYTELAEAERRHFEEQKKEFEQSTDYLDLRDKLVQGTNEYKDALETFQSSLKKTVQASRELKDISVFGAQGKIISGEVLKTAEDDILKFAKKIEKEFGLSFDQAKKAAIDAFREIDQEQKNLDRSWDGLLKNLGKGNADLQDELLRLGQQLQVAFDSGDLQKVEDIVNGISVVWGVDLSEAIDISRSATEKFRSAARESLEQTKKATKELNEAWNKFYLDRQKDTAGFQSSLQNLAKFIYSQKNTPGVFLSLEDVLSRDTVAVEKFAAQYGLKIPEALKLAEGAVDDYAKQTEQAAKEAKDAFDDLDQSLRQGTSAYKESVQALREEIVRLQGQTLESGQNSERVFQRQKEVIQEFSQEWGVTLPDAIGIAKDAIDEYDKKQEDAAKNARDAFRKAVEEINKAWEDFVRGGIEATDAYREAVSGLGESISRMRADGDVQGQTQEVLRFASAWGVDFATALGTANQAAQQFEQEQKQRAAAVQQAWQQFNRQQVEGSEAYKAALTTLGQELLRYQGQQQATEGITASFARQFGLELPQAIGIAGQALQKAQGEIEAQREAESAYLKEVDGLWQQFDQTRLEASAGFQASLSTLGQQLLENGNNIQASKNDVQDFANQYGIAIPEAIRLGTQAFQEASQASSQTTSQMAQDALTSTDIWERYWQAVTQGSEGYKTSLATLGEQLLANTENEQASQQAILDFADKWKIDVPEAIDAGISALADARDASGQTSDGIGGDAEEIAGAFDELRTHILRASEGYESSFARLGQLVAENKGDLQSLRPEIQDFADTWGFDLPDAIREAERAYDDVRQASQQAADDMAQDAQRIEDSFKDYFETFQSESSAYKTNLDQLGKDLVGLGSNVEGQRAKIEAFAQAWGIDLTEAINEAKSAVRAVLEEQEEARNGWGHLQTYAQAANTATQAALAGTQAAFNTTGKSAEALGQAISRSVVPGQAVDTFKDGFEKKVTTPIQKANEEAVKLQGSLANISFTTGNLGLGFSSGRTNSTTPPAYTTPPPPGYNFGGFARGGAFVVPGTGGTDSKRVTFKASPGEVVSIAPSSRAQAQQAGSGSGRQIVFKDCAFYGSPDRSIADKWAYELGQSLGRLERRGQVPVLNKKKAS